MISNNSSLEVHNKFELQLCDVDGNIEQEAYAYNAANSLLYILSSTEIRGNDVGGPNSYWGSLFLVLGDGDVSETPPKETDRFLINRRFVSQIASYEFKRVTPFTKEYQTIEYQSLEHSFPATRDYIADLTEIGLCCQYSNIEYPCYSHASLVDSEGNPIIVKKTEYNILKVKCTIYITPILAVPNSALHFKFFPAYSSVLGGCCTYPQSFWGSGDRIPVSTFYSQTLPSVEGGNSFYFSPQYVPESSDGIIYDNPMMIAETKIATSLNLISTSWRYNQKASYDNTQVDYSPVFPITRYINNVLISQNYKNFGFAHSIVFPNFGAISLPNETILPKYTIDVAIGTGDGEKTLFFTSVNELAVDENEDPILKVYFQNSEEGDKTLVDSSLYTFTNFSAKKSPLWNKMVYVEDKKTLEKIPTGSYTMNDALSPYYGREDTCIAGCCALSNSSFAATCTRRNKQVERLFAPSIAYDAIYYDENGITLDEGKIGTFGTINYGEYNKYWYNPTLQLHYKDSAEEEWTEDKSISIPASSTNASEFVVTKFTPITAKYWKLTSNVGIDGAAQIVSKASNNLNACSFSLNDAVNKEITGLDPNFIILGNSAEYDFSKVGLSFTTPPPAGTIITMEATLDLPYKTPDGSMTFSFQSTLNPPNTGA